MAEKDIAREAGDVPERIWMNPRTVGLYAQPEHMRDPNDTAEFTRADLARPTGGGTTSLCPVHRSLEDRGALEVGVGNDCMACSLNERQELLDLLAPFAAPDASEDTVTVLRRLADFYDTHQGEGRVVVSYPSTVPRCGHFKPSALGVPAPEDRYVKPEKHEGNHSLAPTPMWEVARGVAQEIARKRLLKYYVTSTVAQDDVNVVVAIVASALRTREEAVWNKAIEIIKEAESPLTALEAAKTEIK